MNNEQALSVLRRFNAWRRYDGPVDESPAMPDPKEIGKALDVAIHELEIKCQEPPKREYYGQ